MAAARDRRVATAWPQVCAVLRLGRKKAVGGDSELLTFFSLDLDEKEEDKVIEEAALSGCGDAYDRVLLAVKWGEPRTILRHLEKAAATLHPVRDMPRIFREGLLTGRPDVVGCLIDFGEIIGCNPRALTFRDLDTLFIAEHDHYELYIDMARRHQNRKREAEMAAAAAAFGTAPASRSASQQETSHRCSSLKGWLSGIHQAGRPSRVSHEAQPAGPSSRDHEEDGEGTLSKRGRWRVLDVMRFSIRLQARPRDRRETAVLPRRSTRWHFSRRRAAAAQPPRSRRAAAAQPPRQLLRTLAQAIAVDDGPESPASTLHTMRGRPGTAADGASCAVVHVSVSADGQWLAAADCRGDVAVYSIDTMSFRTSLPPLAAPPTAIAFVPRTSILAAALATKQARGRRVTAV